MLDVADIYQIPLPILSERCAEETKRYLKQLFHDTQYCFELFRRALVDSNQQAYELICIEYKGMVTQWVNSRLRFPYINEDVEECVNWAFASMFNSLSKNNNFAKFPALDRILGYLQSCAYSSAVGKNRKSKILTEEIPKVFDSDMGLDSEIDFDSGIDIVHDILDEEKNKAIRALVEANLKNEQERIVYEDYFEWSFMPKQIYARHPDQFRNVQDVSRVKQILLERLARIFRRDWEGDES